MPSNGTNELPRRQEKCSQPSRESALSSQYSWLIGEIIGRQCCCDPADQHPAFLAKTKRLKEEARRLCRLLGLKRFTIGCSTCVYFEPLIRDPRIGTYDWGRCRRREFQKPWNPYTVHYHLCPSDDRFPRRPSSVCPEWIFAELSGRTSRRSSPRDGAAVGGGKQCE